MPLDTVHKKQSIRIKMADKLERLWFLFRGVNHFKIGVRDFFDFLISTMTFWLFSWFFYFLLTFLIFSRLYFDFSVWLSSLLFDYFLNFLTFFLTFWFFSWLLNFFMTFSKCVQDFFKLFTPRTLPQQMHGILWWHRFTWFLINLIIMTFEDPWQIK